MYPSSQNDSPTMTEPLTPEVCLPASSPWNPNKFANFKRKRTSTYSKMNLPRSAIWPYHLMWFSLWPRWQHSMHDL